MPRLIAIETLFKFHSIAMSLEEGLDRLLRSSFVGRLKGTAYALMALSIIGVAAFPNVENSPLITHIRQQLVPKPSAVPKTIMLAGSKQVVELSPFVVGSPHGREVSPAALELISNR